jgi:transcription antitermination factor NusG
VSQDQRDNVSWVVLELTRQGEARVEDGTLASAILEALGTGNTWPVFIPSYSYCRGGHRVTIHLMEGYAFVATGLNEADYLGLERDCPYVKKVLTVDGPNGMPVLSVVGAAQVQDMHKQLREIVSSDISEGMRVNITQGKYARLEGDVLGMEGDDAHVLIVLRSFQKIATIPTIFLEPMGEGEANV